MVGQITILFSRLVPTMTMIQAPLQRIGFIGHEAVDPEVLLVVQAGTLSRRSLVYAANFVAELGNLNPSVRARQYMLE